MYRVVSLPVERDLKLVFATFRLDPGEGNRNGFFEHNLALSQIVDNNLCRI